MKKKVRKQGYTLVELLIVIFIIGVLAALIVPALGRARATALNVSCVSNLKSIGTGLLQYIHQYDDYLPPVAPEPGRQWYYVMMPFIENWAIYQCPAKSQTAWDVPEVWDEDLDQVEKFQAVHYGMNARLLRDLSIMSTSYQFGSIRSHNKVIFADAAYFDVLQEGRHGFEVPDPNFERPDSVTMGAVWFPEEDVEMPTEVPVIAPRHLGRVNLLYLDGSVFGMTPEDILQNPRGTPNCIYQSTLH